ncbi:MAG: hypothetical protein U9Q03_02105 [Patescibacteria group bacterium]|nr:hypothetical protein [Patescibacteria group bacterium]
MIFGKDEGRLSRAEGVPRISRARHEEDEKKRAMLTVAVIAVTVVIVTAWLLTLPMQLRKFEILDNESVARWYVVREEMEGETGNIQEQLDKIKEQLDVAAGELEIASGLGISEGDSGGLSAEGLAERLRAKLMEAESLNQNEQDATQED